MCCGRELCVVHARRIHGRATAAAAGAAHHWEPGIDRQRTRGTGRASAPPAAGTTAQPCSRGGRVSLPRPSVTQALHNADPCPVVYTPAFAPTAPPHTHFGISVCVSFGVLLRDDSRVAAARQRLGVVEQARGRRVQECGKQET